MRDSEEGGGERREGGEERERDRCVGEQLPLDRDLTCGLGEDGWSVCESEPGAQGEASDGGGESDSEARIMAEVQKFAALNAQMEQLMQLEQYASIY